MSVESMDRRVTFGMLVKGLGDRLKGIMAKSLTAEEKLNMITQEMGRDVEQKRVVARSIYAKMIALSNPETAALEPLERLKAQREKLVKSGTSAMKEKEAAEAANDANLAKQKTNLVNRIAQDIKSLDTQLTSMTSTYETLKEAYEVALDNFKVAQTAYEHVKTNGSGLLFAIKAHQDALSIRDNTRKEGTANDTSFLTDLENDLNTAQSTLRSDKEIDREAGLNTVSDDDSSGNEDIINEFKSSK